MLALTLIALVAGLDRTVRSEARVQTARAVEVGTQGWPTWWDDWWSSWNPAPTPAPTPEPTTPAPTPALGALPDPSSLESYCETYPYDCPKCKGKSIDCGPVDGPRPAGRCDDVMCSMDMCPDGSSRREIDGKCCACPKQKEVPVVVKPAKHCDDFMSFAAPADCTCAEGLKKVRVHEGSRSAGWGCQRVPQGCGGVMCAMDMCPDGSSRREIDGECCACPKSQPLKPVPAPPMTGTTVRCFSNSQGDVVRTRGAPPGPGYELNGAACQSGGGRKPLPRRRPRPTSPAAPPAEDPPALAETCSGDFQCLGFQRSSGWEPVDFESCCINPGTIVRYEDKAARRFSAEFGKDRLAPDVRNYGLEVITQFYGHADGTFGTAVDALATAGDCTAAAVKTCDATEVRVTYKEHRRAITDQQWQYQNKNQCECKYDRGHNECLPFENKSSQCSDTCTSKIKDIPEKEKGRRYFGCQK